MRKWVVKKNGPEEEGRGEGRSMPGSIGSNYHREGRA